MLYLLEGRVLLCLALIALISLCACGGEQAGAYIEDISPGVEGAIYDGIILFMEDAEADAILLVQVELKDLYQEVPITANMRFSEVWGLSFSRTNGYATIFVEEGDWVYEGDLLATLSFEDEEFIINRRLAEIRLEQFDRDFVQSLQEMEYELANARERHSTATDRELAAASLAVQLLEAELQVFRHNQRIAREGIYNVLYEINSTIAGDNIYSPIDGIVGFTIRDGSFLIDLRSAVIVFDETSFYFAISIESRHIATLPAFVSRNVILRYGDVIAMESSARAIYLDEDGEYLYSRPILEFDVEIINDPLSIVWLNPTLDDFIARPVDVPGFVQAIEEIAPNILDLHFASFSHGNLHFYLATDAMMVPSAALRIGDGANYVMEYIDGVLHKRYVVVGIIRAGYAQIISGLDAWSRVVVFG